MFRFRGCFSVRVSTCLFIFTLCGRIIGALNERVKVTVMKEDDVILPCSLSTKENIVYKQFDWKKDGQKEVFYYDSGIHYNNQPLNIQDPQFRGRVFHFQDELKRGIASIIIRNTTAADSGDYICIFPRLQPSQTFHIELLVLEEPEKCRAGPPIGWILIGIVVVLVVLVVAVVVVLLRKCFRKKGSTEKNTTRGRNSSNELL